ncbi:probable phenylalanine--tRNA ligase, mitochondrial [Procambarus clarkii]|uniref:probable phenylalanine--tRNA ligase, mitochondrial n=1 Tax=Procambarus clarkii TaxID=6728 RepID=UPI003741FE36
MVLQVLRSPHVKCLHSSWRACITRKYFVTTTYKQGEQITVEGREYQTDHMTNVTPHLLSLVGRSLHMQKYHPLNHISQRIVHYMYQRYVSSRGNPLFSVHNNIHPVVTTHQNFDSLLIPKNHVSRQKSDNYYINEGHLLRAHTSAHQSDLIGMGFDNFLVIGDVYRRDEIDSSHYPVFHQVEGVRLCTKREVNYVYLTIHKFCM